MDAWAYGFCTLVKIAKWNLQSGYAVLGMLLHLELQYLQSTFPGVGTIMVPIEKALRKTFLPAFFLRWGSTSTSIKSWAIELSVVD